MAKKYSLKESTLMQESVINKLDELDLTMENGEKIKDWFENI